jgi:hypothetical protein
VGFSPSSSSSLPSSVPRRFLRFGRHTGMPASNRCLRIVGADTGWRPWRATGTGVGT